MISHTVESQLSNTTEDAVISAIEKSKLLYVDGAQAVHIIIANLICAYGQDKWKAVVSVIREPNRNNESDEAIVFAQLPKKYAQVYDDLLPHVDHVNIIDDDSIWTNIKLYLLDIYFYQAVHFNALQRMRESGGGYFRELDDSDIKLDIEFTMSAEERVEENRNDRNELYDDAFYKEVDAKEIKLFRTKEERLRWRKAGNMRHQSKEFVRMLKNEG